MLICKKLQLLVHLWEVLRLAVEKRLCTPEFDRQE